MTCMTTIRTTEASAKTPKNNEFIWKIKFKNYWLQIARQIAYLP